MRAYNGSCGGTCYKCICQECEGNCAMHCSLTNNTEEYVLMSDDEEYAASCKNLTRLTNQ